MKLKAFAVLVLSLLCSLPATASEVPLFDGLGGHRRKITTASPEAQRYFDQGLNFLYAFNHDEAIRSFRKAAELDPSCAMAWWGVAVANGPHINYPAVPPERAKAAWEALVQAKKNAPRAKPDEQALIAALEKRYADPQPEDRAPLDRAYAEAMREAARKFPNDADVGALFAEALMDLTPWDLYTSEGAPRPGTPEVLKTLEAVLKRASNHPLALHLTIHAWEMSRTPGKAAVAADRLRDLAPGLGHLVHMPSHIDVRLGRWEKAIAANVKAEEADRKYREKSPDQNFYRYYMMHNQHMRAFAAMMIGRRREAVETLDRMAASIPPDWAKENASIVDGAFAMPVEARLRFGMWDAVLEAIEPEPHFPMARALRHYARGVALAALGRSGEAHAENAAFLVGRSLVPAATVFGNNAASDLLNVAQALLEGEILVRDGHAVGGIESLRRGVALEDGLRYDEPPDWIHPVRHALGAVLLKEGRFVEAEKVLREDLRILPENGWSLLGLASSLEGQSKAREAEAARQRFEKAWSTADVPLTSPCYCQP